MTPIKATIDTQTFTRKPSGAEIARISTRIVKNSIDLDTIDCTRNCSVSRNEVRIPADNHKLYRSYVIEELDNCLLYQDFSNGTSKLEHDELFHILNNMINIETGVDKFLSVIAEYPELYGDKLERWKEHADYNRKHDYKPSTCSKFCSYHNECDHGKTILSTVHKIGISMEPIEDYNEEFYPITEVESDVYDCINSAFMASDNKIHVIKAQTAIGKS